MTHLTHTQPHALYRFYSDAGQLLYVGITNNPGNRFSQHQADKPWWGDVSGISIEQYESREEALAAEARAIHVERPLHNIKRPTVGKRRSSPAPRVTRQLVWKCETCDQPVADGKGYIHVDVRAASQHGQDMASLTEEVKASNRLGWEMWTGDYLRRMMALEEARWEVHHRECDPNPDRDDYWFDVARARTHAHLLDWTAHLMDKNWLEDTTWGGFIRTAAAVDA